MTLSQQQQLFSQNVAKLIEHIYSSGDAVTFGEAWRTPEQAALYAQQGKGIKDSLHCQRLAVDLNLFKNGNYTTVPEHYKPYATFWESLHPLNRSGINFPRGDANHFEMKEESHE